MAQGSSSNQLTIGVRADASKLRADLALAQAQVGLFGKELRSAAAESLKTGDTTAIRGLADAFEGARGNVARLRGEIGTIAGVGQHFAPAHRAVADLHTGFGNVSASVANLVNTLAPSIGSKMALGVGGAAAALAKLATGSAHAVTEISNLSKVSGFSIDTIDALRDVTKKIVDRDEIGKFVVKFSEEMGKARLEASKTANEVHKGITVLSGSALQSSKDLSGGVRSMVGDVEKLRGAGRSVRDTSNAFSSLDINVNKFADNAAGNQAAMIAWAKALSEVKDKTEQTRIGVQMAGKQWMIYGAAILELDKTLPKAILENMKSGLGITPQMVKDAEDYRGQVADLGDAWQDMSRKVGLTVVPSITFMVQKTGESFENMKVTGQAFGGLMTAVWEKMRRDHGGTMDAIVLKTQEANTIMQQAGNIYFQFMKDNFTTVTTLIDGLIQRQMSVAQTALQWALDALGKLASAASSAWAASPAASAPIPTAGFAGGGRVPGHGAGDTVRALLTPGEFVQRVAAVRYYGVDFMRRLNALQIPRFELGGIVESLRDGLSLPTQRFAMGGMVDALGAAGGGSKSSWTLVLDGQSFSAQSDANTLASLQRSARRRQMMSAGRKSSSYT